VVELGSGVLAWPNAGFRSVGTCAAQMLISFSGAVHNVSRKYRIGVGKTRQDSSLSITDPCAQDAGCVSQRFPPQDSDMAAASA
jgi:hypothetical protein